MIIDFTTKYTWYGDATTRWNTTVTAKISTAHSETSCSIYTGSKSEQSFATTATATELHAIATAAATTSSNQPSQTKPASTTTAATKHEDATTILFYSRFALIPR